MSTVRTESTSALWHPQRRAFTVGLILLVTLIAFEAMGLATALPTMVNELGGQRFYSWPFTVFMAASAVSTVLGGRLADRHGPALPLLLAVPTFALGLLLAGLTPSMTVLLMARALQGLGAGAQIVALYVMIARVYPEQHRPQAFAALSTAWVVPALVGPAVAGLLTEHLSWRWVFLGLAPLVAVGAVLLAPSLRRLRPPEVAAPARSGLPLAALGAAGGAVGLTWAAQNPSWLSLALGVASVVALLASSRVLLPAGTLRGRRGIPVMVLSRGLLAGTFFAAQAFVPLTLTAVHDYSPATAGIPLTVGSLGWTLGALWQSRNSNLSREYIVSAGLALVATATAGLTVTAPAWGPHWMVFVLWAVGGLGMGIAVASTGVRVLALSPRSEQGFHSSALQLSDMLTQTVLIGLAGVLVTALASTEAPTRGVVTVDVLLALSALVGAALARRSGRTTLESS